MKLNRIDHVAIICSNYERSKRFYVDVLGCKIVNEINRSERQSFALELSVNGLYQIELFSFPNPPKRSSNPEACGLRHLAFQVDDLDAVIAELKSKDVPVEDIRINTVNGKRLAFFRDPDGLPIELCENRPS